MYTFHALLSNQSFYFIIKLSAAIEICKFDYDFRDSTLNINEACPTQSHPGESELQLENNSHGGDYRQIRRAYAPPSVLHNTCDITQRQHIHKFGD